MVFLDGDPGPEIRRKLNEMVGTWEDAIANAKGWSPVLSVVSAGERRVLQIVDWIDGIGAKPTTSGYIGATGIVTDIALAVDIRGPIGLTGPAGPSNTLAIGTVVTGISSSATITGTSPNQTLNLTLQKGDKGDTGNTGPAGPPNTLAIGTVTSGASPSATITGTSPNQTLNLVLQKGDKGDTGDTGPANTLAIGTVTSGASPSATITGTSPNQTLNLILQKGDKGDTGDKGDKGDTGWTPILAVISDGTRRVQQVIDWTGGQGAKPATGQYVGITGLVTDIALAVDIRGPAGTGNVSSTGAITADSIAVFADTTGSTIKSLGAALGTAAFLNTEQLPVSIAMQAALDAKQGALVSGTNIKTINGTSILGSGNLDLASQVALDAHTGAASNAHSASAIGNTPAGNIAATTVQAAINELDTEKEPTIAAGTTAQYWRGDKSWRDFFTDVRAATLTGFSTATNAVVVAADTVLAALGKLQAQITSLGTSKQNTLVSGTNIKTVNSITLLGSGNVAVGDVTGPASSVSGNVASFNGTTGKALQDSGKALPVGAIVGTTDTQTLTNKTINLASNTVSGTVAQFNAVLSDGDFATLAGSETLTNKTLGDPKLLLGGTNGTAGQVPVSQGAGLPPVWGDTGGALKTGDTLLTAGTLTAPDWLPADGTTYLQSSYPALFAKVGFISDPSAPWAQRTSSFGIPTIRGVTYGNGLFVAVGDSGKLATSPDGITWTQRTSSFGSTAINGVTYGNGLYVAVSDGGKLATSPDGIDWTQRTSSFGTTIIRGVTYGNGLFVAVGDSGKLATSPDGINWTQRTSSFVTAIYGVTYGNGLYVAVGDGGKLATSPDGINWTQRTSSFGTTIIRGVAYGNGIYVAVGGSGKLATSPDGINWTQRTSSFGTYEIYGATYGNGLYVAFGDTGQLATSPDGINWTQRTSSFGTTPIYGVTCGNWLYVAVGGSGQLATPTLGYDPATQFVTPAVGNVGLGVRAYVKT